MTDLYVGRKGSKEFWVYFSNRSLVLEVKVYMLGPQIRKDNFVTAQ